MNKRLASFILSLCILFATYAQETTYKYRIWLSDKEESEFSISNPEEFLSEKCIERRQKRGIEIDDTDLPVCREYINQIAEKGCRIITTSKWQNTVVVEVNDVAVIDEIEQLPFVLKSKCVWRSDVTADPNRKEYAPSHENNAQRAPHPPGYALDYGISWEQVNMLKVDSLHFEGYRGEGVTIAVLDAGFRSVENSAYIHHENILGKHVIVPDYNETLQSKHGTEVLSCMAAEDEGSYIGTAPRAQYWLIVTEDTITEQLVEEDYWVAGIEYADSVGADIVNSSLAYCTFDDSSMNYTHDQLNGRTSFCSRAANIASGKGMLVVVAAGNEYLNSWHKITFPSDAEGVVSVGSVDKDGIHSSFSSCGYTADGRIKPDVVAMGSNIYAITADDTQKRASGTSYSTPILCGALACLWQAHPSWSVEEIIDNLHRYSSQHSSPDHLCGYGIPDIYAIHRGNSAVTSPSMQQTVIIHNGCMTLPASVDTRHIAIYDTSGRCLMNTTLAAHLNTIPVSHLAKGVYIAVIQEHSKTVTHKIFIH